MARNDAGLPQLLATIRPEIDAALAVIAKKHGLQQLRTGKGTYNPDANNFSLKLEGIAANGKDKDAARLEDFGRFDDELPKLGDKFDQRTGLYTVVGINTTGSKILATDPQGKKWLCPTDAVKKMVARKKGVPATVAA